MARLYCYKRNSSRHFLLGSVDGANTTIQCTLPANQIFQEINYTPGVRRERRGPKLPGELVYGMWETGLLFTGDSDRGNEQRGTLTEDGESPKLAKTDRDALQELLSGYGGPHRDMLEDLADTLGISATSGPTGVTNDKPSSPDIDSVEDAVLRTILEEAGVVDILPVVAFKELYNESLLDVSVNTLRSSPETVRALAFLAEQEDVISISVKGAADPDKVTTVTGLFSRSKTFDTEAEISLTRFNTSDGFLPVEGKRSGLWDDDFPTAWWYVSSTVSPESAETANSLFCETSIDLNSSGVDSVHTDVWGAKGHFREDYAIRRHQVELTEQVLERHTGNSAPFSLPADIEFSQYYSAANFYDEPIAEHLFD